MTTIKPLRLGVLISGNGSNLQAIIDEIAAGHLDARVELVISSNPEARGLRRAQQAGIPTLFFQREDYSRPCDVDEIIVAELQKHAVDYVVLAGYMRMVTGPLLRAFPNHIVNLHPALLPSFPGAHGIQDAWNARVKVSGITVHFANEDYDEGPIIAQRAVEIREGDTIEDFEARIHEAEHKLLPAVLQALVQGRISIDANDPALVHWDQS